MLGWIFRWEERTTAAAERLSPERLEYEVGGLEEALRNHLRATALLSSSHHERLVATRVLDGDVKELAEKYHRSEREGRQLLLRLARPETVSENIATGALVHDVKRIVRQTKELLVLDERTNPDLFVRSA
jgi:hypothetical protein